MPRQDLTGTLNPKSTIYETLIRNSHVVREANSQHRGARIPREAVVPENAGANDTLLRQNPAATLDDPLFKTVRTLRHP